MVWTSAVPMTGSSLGEVRRKSNVVTASAPMRSTRETYTPGSRSMWLTVKLAILSMGVLFCLEVGVGVSMPVYFQRILACLSIGAHSSAHLRKKCIDICIKWMHSVTVR